MKKEVKKKLWHFVLQVLSALVAALTAAGTASCVRG